MLCENDRLELIIVDDFYFPKCVNMCRHLILLVEYRIFVIVEF